MRLRSIKPFLAAPLSLAVALCTVLSLGAHGAAAAAEIRLAAYTFDPAQGVPILPEDLHLDAPAAETTELPWIVQLTDRVDDADRRFLESAGQVLGYLPDDAFLVRASAERIAALANDAAVRWTGLWQPAFKLSPQIGRHEFLNPERRDAPERTLLVWTCGDVGATREALTATGATVRESFPRRVGRRWVVTAADERLAALAALPHVLWIEEQPEFRLLNDRSTWVVQTNASGNHAVWDQGLHGEGQLAIVMDSGLDYNSCWFRDPGLTPGPTHRKVIKYQTFGGAAYDGCSIGHGTHVCGTLAGNQTTVNPGVTTANGVAYEAKLSLQDVGSDDFISCLFGFVNVPSDLTNAFQTGYNDGGHVHSNSWGSTSNAYDGYAVDIDDFLWTHPSFLILFAAGNSGPSSSTVGSPGTAKNCVTVGATRQAPNQGQMASYSSRGPASDGRLKPTLCAPGGDESLYITSAQNHTGNPPAQTCNTVSSPFMGTSMATPAVAGSALLVRQYFVEGFYPTGAATVGDELTPTGALLKAMLTNGGTDIGTANIPNNDEGWGRLLLDDVLYFDGDARELRLEEETTGLATGGFLTYDYEVEAGEPFEVTLVWTDYPGTSGASPAIVNDLDLTVTGPGGTWLGNVFSGGQSVTGGTRDSRNVEEVVRLASPAAGTYTLRVDGARVPLGPQPFALVATGAFANWPQVGVGVDETIAISVPAAALDLRLTPNPARSEVTIALALPADRAGSVEVTVYDVHGARVADVHRGALPAGRTSLRWNGRDDAARPVPSGVYFVRATAGAETVTKKVTLIR